MSGKVIWFEVMGKDSDKLQAFYGGLFGWEFEPGPDWPDYGMIEPPEDGVGIAGAVGKAPAGPGWTTFYVQVDDLESSLVKAKALGAEVFTPPTRLPDKSTIALVKDPEGHVLGLVKSAS